MKSIQRATLILCILICIFFAAILILELTEDELSQFTVPDYILLMSLFFIIIVLSWVSFQSGRYAERYRLRQRIENVKYLKQK